MGKERSIPACAGKPATVQAMRARQMVHPRVCGEAGRDYPYMAGGRGPSPRVRGSHRDRGAVAVLVGSIPACAGKPLVEKAGAADVEVHPRVCGEALPERYWEEGVAGPSPRVRGSRQDLVDRQARVGSIPACAGKPWRSTWGTA